MHDHGHRLAGVRRQNPQKHRGNPGQHRLQAFAGFKIVQGVTPFVSGKGFRMQASRIRVGHAFKKAIIALAQLRLEPLL